MNNNDLLELRPLGMLKGTSEIVFEYCLGKHIVRNIEDLFCSTQFDVVDA